MARERDNDHPLLHYTRDDSRATSSLRVDLERTGHPGTTYLLGQFLENLAFSIVGGISAQILNNPTFHHKHHLESKQMREFMKNGEALLRLYLSGGDPHVLRSHHWISTPLATGFGVCVLDDAPQHNLQFGWSPLGYPGSATASAGRIGGAVRLQGGDWPAHPDQRWPVLEDGPAGIRQGVFLPIMRCLAYKGDLWVRLGTTNQAEHGEVEVGFRRRVATPDGRRHAGESLAAVRIPCSGAEWQKLPFALELREGQVAFGEPIDFYIRWMPHTHRGLNLLLDRAFLFPQDDDDGIDPDVVALVRTMSMPLLRFPGGNFVSYHHWRDAVGPTDLRPTVPNYAWGGLDYNIFGTDEFMNFCQKVGTRPHITVNTGTGTAEEAAAWVEYCNGDITTPMGRLRARNGHPEPYHVTLWEVGNESFAAWQGGFHGSDENARRFAEFAPAMRAASPIPIELIASGSNFDFAEPGIGYDHTAADRRWHDQLLKQAPDQIDYISLHSLPENEVLLEHVTDEEAHNAVLAQVVTWERRFLPELLERCDRVQRADGSQPIKLAITEWGALGTHPNRLMVENFGGVIYTGTFLNMIIRNSERIPLAIVNGFMHGGCIRKAYGRVYVDPQISAMQQYAPFQGAIPVACQLTGPGYDVVHPSDLGGTDADIPFVDAVVCRSDADSGLLIAAANRHLTKSMTIAVQIPGYQLPDQVTIAVLAYPEITARATPVQPEFPLRHTTVTPDGDTFALQLPPFSVAWINL